MNEEEDFYYLHSTTKDLIFKRFRPEDDSDFVEKTWAVDTKDRACAWTIVLEALSMGARIERVKELAEKWKLTQEDFEEMIARVRPTSLMVHGTIIFLRDILGLNVDEYWQDLTNRKEGDAKT